MNEKIVTHADLPALQALNHMPVPRDWREETRAAVADLLNRATAAAEADQPPLPEGWVLHTTPAGSRAVFWHRDGYLYQWDDDDESTRPVQPFPSSKNTPLRPTVTKADVEKAARAARAAYFDGADLDAWDTEHRGVRDDWIKTARATLDTLGIEVRS